MARTGLANRLYRGEANLNIVGRRKMWFTIAAVAVLIAIASFFIRGFSLGIDFQGGNEFRVPTSVGTQVQVSDAVKRELAKLPAGKEAAKVVSVQTARGEGASNYLIRTTQLES